MVDCHTCGVNLMEQSEYQFLQDYVQIYFHLTAIKLEEQTDKLAELKICSICVIKLHEFDSFRELCLQVYWRSHHVKSENEHQQLHDDGFVCKTEIPGDDQMLVAVEWKHEELEDDHIDNPFASDPESDKEDSLIESLSHKTESKAKNKPAKGGSRKKQQLSQESTQLYSCDLCPKQFRVELRLQAHKRTHDGLQPYECELCGKVFAKWNSLQMHHTQKHSDNKVELPCTHPGCEQTFTTRQSLKRHRLKAHDPSYVMPEPEVVICDTCGKTFSSNGALKKHRYIHMPDDMPFVCGVCSKKFPTSNKLKEHTMRHEGIKNHICTYCGLRKTTGHELKSHIKTVHSKEQSHPCSDCTAVFSNSGNLNRHVKIVHLGLRPFICSVCQKSFGKNHHLKRHMKNHSLSAEELEQEPIEPTVAEVDRITGV